MSRTSAPASAPTSARLKSVDVLRGATIVAMILVNSQFSQEHSYPQFVHAGWNGWTFADTIFPCFLFIVGISLTLSTASRMARAEEHTYLLWHALRRALLIFGSGVVIDYLRIPSREFPFIGFEDHIQLSGVLQKIAVCYLAAFLIYFWSGLRGVVLGIIGLNLVYLGLLYLYPVPGCGAGSLDISCNFPGYLDAVVLDGFRSNYAAFDPDGIGAILPAITSVLFGILAGEFLQRDRKLQQYQLFPLLSGGIVLIAAGELIGIWVPINKPLWTPSFVVFTSGLAAIALACTIWLVEGRSWGRWFRPLEIFGLNAIAAYLISRVVGNLPRVHITGKSLHADILAPLASPPIASLLFAIVVLSIVYLVVWLMDRRGWYVKF
jgi:predicted acyltransferase